MATRLPPPNARGVSQIQTVINGLLDRGYTQTTNTVLRAIAGGANTPLIQQRFAELQAEANRLQTEGKSLTGSNPVLRALLADLQPILERNAVLIDAVAPETQLNGVAIAGDTAAISSTGFTPQQLDSVGVQWFQPNAEAVNANVGYASSEAFADGLGRYVDGIEDVLIRQTMRGIGPRQAAREIIRMAEELPPAWANSTLRTLQVTAYRDATVANRVANADILDVQIRLSALQVGRTCMACVALHGTELPIDQRIDDHNNGLCTSICQVKGLPKPQVQRGTDWFGALPKADQERWMSGAASGAAWRAYDAGTTKLEDFVGTYENAIFGTQVVPRSLKEILGPDTASTFYSFPSNGGATPS